MLCALAFGKMTAVLSVVKRHYPVVIGAGGIILVGMGVLIFTGEFTTLNQTVDGWLQTLHLPNFNSDT
jgi:cytochrome c-type biogenesis protein